LVASGVGEMVYWLMEHVLSVNPRHPSWLRTQADIQFGVYGCVFNDIYGLSEWRDRIRKQCPSFEEFGDSCRKAEAMPVGVRDL